MKDRVVNGFLAGIIAAIVSTIFNLILIELYSETLRYVDFSGVFIYGRIPRNLAEDSFALVGLLVFNGVLGILFNYVVPHISSRYYYFKALTFSVGVWFLIFAVTVLFKIPYLAQRTFESSVINFVSSVVHGVMLGLVLYRIQSASKVH